MATIDIKYQTQPHDGQPGTPWDDFEERIKGVLSGYSDERGWSLADCVMQTDTTQRNTHTRQNAARARALLDADSRRQSRLGKATRRANPRHRSLA